MFNKTDFLRFAFEEATNTVNVNSIESATAERVINMKMRAYAQREGFDFSEKEIRDTTKRGLENLKNAGADFTFQMKMMN